MKYHKIHTIFKRDKDDRMILGDWTHPIFEYLADKLWSWTEKIDGTNIRIRIDPSEGDVHPLTVHGVRFDGRTDSAAIPAELVNWLCGMFLHPKMLHDMSKAFPSGAILYGEGYGAGTAKGGGNYASYQSFILFDVKIGEWWLERKNVDNVAENLGLKSVPVLGELTLHQAVAKVAAGFNSTFGAFAAEGLVGEPLVPMFDRAGERVIAKIKTRDWMNLAEKK